MIELVTSAQMRAIETAAIESGAVRGLDLMERAAEGVVAALVTRWPGAERACVLCGPGNNGGDGFAVARLLAARGWTVRVLAAAGADRMPPDAVSNARAWTGPVAPLTAEALAEGPQADVYVDAVFGTGLSRPVTGELARVVAALARVSARVVAVDAPSGLCLDSGRSLIPGGIPARAALTVTFGWRKPGHVLAQGPELCGEMVTVDIGVAAWREAAGVTASLVTPDDPAFAQLDKTTAAHKFTHGHALILTGGMGRTGAARLSARAALRIGAGLVTLGAPGSAMMEVAAQITALMLRRIDSPEALAEALADTRITALCLGPGLGIERAAALLGALREGGVKPRPTVVDADALTALGPVSGALPEDWVLTPHGGEFARLFPDLAARLSAEPANGPAFSRLDAGRQAAARAGCVVVLKGPDTVIAAPDGRSSVHAASGAQAAPWLATAGSGDVLAGIITGLLARGVGSYAAACTGTWLHAAAARHVGPGLIAEDLPEALPAVLRRVIGHPG
ncbi:NAD(P)H-hydrate dehydratase [Pararhodobacter zhoushanensis]|uniref:Bifunctional NAD(P)H-hydrate repair enzyme n=1 Tax=Pararhodobacter zhoushanensis TaxID=2479545 RepID=A0ABT3GYN2_9RHOB|nr:NAD(P)H-hydrate dehydratase [Pararhodobacter zhoushanensis]MCW1932679.1 NAD(P)H-hydrate dehydratase [Pararhodobacter zhoushanensis]